ncbi:MAG TPA: class I SAM-dependent methyltransferase [Acidimicrobiales bacterium]|nr:class I SAM-dependent methyltransferase [Acidimicrobiales bacterium]
MTSGFEPEAIAASYDAVAEEYARRLSHELDYKPADRALLDEVACIDGVVCDLGCGPGHVARYLADRGAEVVGVDLSAGMVDVARRLHPGLRFEVGNMLELGERGWRAIVALYSLIHIDRPQVPVALHQMHEALVPGGTLVLAVHAGTGEIRHDTFMDHDVAFTGTFFELDELTGLVESAGFTISSALERAPYPDEGATRRVYIIATK